MDKQQFPDFAHIMKIAQQVASKIDPPAELKSGKVLTEDEMNKAIKDSEIAFKEKLDTLSKYLVIQKPFSTKDVETEADKILVSFKAGKKVATKGVRKIKKDGKKVIAQRDILIDGASELW
jgi:CRISPR-associated endonuclease Csn1